MIAEGLMVAKYRRLTAQMCYVHFSTKLRFWHWVIARAPSPI